MQVCVKRWPQPGWGTVRAMVSGLDELWHRPCRRFSNLTVPAGLRWASTKPESSAPCTLSAATAQL